MLPKAAINAVAAMMCCKSNNPGNGGASTIFKGLYIDERPSGLDLLYRL
jgi:hypothetical protein